jgi:hypothetical protein
VIYYPGANEPDARIITLKEWVFLIWNIDTLYNAHPAVEDVRNPVNRIGQPRGFGVDRAPENYESPQSQTREEFRLRLKAGGTPMRNSPIRLLIERNKVELLKHGPLIQHQPNKEETP